MYLRNFLLVLSKIFTNFGKILTISTYWKEVLGENICIKDCWIAGSIGNFRGCYLSRRGLRQGIPFFPNAVLSAKPGGLLSDPVLVECRPYPIFYCSIQQLSERMIGQSFFLGGGKVSNFSQIFYANIFLSSFRFAFSKKRLEFIHA